MVDLVGQYQALAPEVQAAWGEILETGAFINGPHVKRFAQELGTYLGGVHVVPCANGTDALQIALMALGLQAGDEVVVPAFTYVATLEVVELLQLKAVLVDVLPDTFNIAPTALEAAISPRARAIVPVHLFGQCCDIAAVLAVAARHNLYVVEDAAQAMGAQYTFPDGRQVHAGTAGTVGTTSFYPSKNLGCYGDGGALFTRDESLAMQLRQVANHGQAERYYFERVGVNSRLDSLQAAVLLAKLPHLPAYVQRRQAAAAYYDEAFAGASGILRPVRSEFSSHAFHQYTLRVTGGKRDGLQAHLNERGIPSSVFYPLALHEQTAYRHLGSPGQFPVAEQLAREVLSLPMHTELTEAQLAYIAGEVLAFFAA